MTFSKTKDWQTSPDADGSIVEGIEDVRQCILNIMTAQKGSDPLRQDFGVDWMGLVDQPVTNIPAAKADLLLNIKKYEPRAQNLRIETEITGEKVVFYVYFSYQNQQAVATS